MRLSIPIRIRKFTLKDSGTKSIYIRVSDNGIGISKVDQKHIFDKFYRVSTGNIHKLKDWVSDYIM